MGDKIEQFLFDIIGLFIPGFVFVMVFKIIFYLFGINSDISNAILDKLNSNMQFLQIPYLMPIAFIIFVYLLGHVIKVLSIYFYYIGTAIFDKNINKLMGYIVVNFLNLIRYNKWSDWVKNIFKIIQTLQDIIKQTFTFNVKDNFHPKCEKCYDYIQNILKNEYGIDSPEWYMVYKIADTIIDNENMKSPSHTFLAKYNFYRSISLIFFISLILFYYLSLNFKPIFLNSSILISILFIFWFSFHYKFKRYWTLCGNEALLALFYFFTEKKKKCGA